MKKTEIKVLADKLGTIKIPSIKTVVDDATSAICEKGLLTFDEENCYILADGRYYYCTQSEAFTFIRQLLPRHMRSKVSKAQIREIFERCMECLDLQVDMDANFLRGEYVVNTLSGLYDVRAQCIVDSLDGYIPDCVLNFNYISHSKLSDAPVFMKFVGLSAGEQEIEVLLQVLGSCISSLQHCRSIFFLMGEGGTGKSTLLDVLESIFPKGMIAHEPLDRIGTEQAKSHYRGKRLNIGRDTKKGIISCEESIKNLASNEWTTSRELYQVSVDYIPRLKFIYASNHFPRFANPDDALLDRLVIVSFPVVLSEADRDTELKKKLLDERDVIFSLALDSLRGLINNNYQYKMGELAMGKLTHQRLLLHNVREFANEMLEFKPDGEISSKDLVASYQTWCNENQIPPLGKEELFDQLTVGHPGVKRSKIGPSDKRCWGYKGVQIRTDGVSNPPKEEM